jgi:hypothetical protein
MSPEYRRVLTYLLGVVYGGVGLYAGLSLQSLVLVGVVVLLAALTYASMQAATVVTERDWERLLPPRKSPPALPPPTAEEEHQ